MTEGAGTGEARKPVDALRQSGYKPRH
jgi:hypothetical protein